MFKILMALIFCSGVTVQAVAKSGSKVKAKDKMETATLAGGCFWGVEDLIRKLPGVIETNVGYTGGNVDSPVYDIVKTGTSGHAESVQIIFDPKKLSYAEVLKFFFRLHDPTTVNQQGNDKGTQYRSAIFYHSKEQQEIAKKVKEEIQEKINKSNPYKNKTVVTEIVEFKKFFPAESYHQDYLVKNPNGYTCHFLRD